MKHNNQLREIIVSYDIENNKKRTEIFNDLKDLGMISIQKSVMWGKLLPADIRLINILLENKLDKEKDKAFTFVARLSKHGVFFGLNPQLEEYDAHAIF